MLLQIVDGRLFTGSHDGTLRVWDASGIKNDSVFGQDDDEDTDKNANTVRITSYGSLVSMNFTSSDVLSLNI